MSPAQEQFARLERYLVRLGGRGATADDRDDLLAFFMHAWHMADWASNDPTLHRTLHEIRSAAKADPHIAICSDLADGIKHLVLTKPPRAYGQLTSRIVAVAGLEHPTASYSVTLPDGSVRDALTLAESTVKAWRKILTGYGLNL